MGTEVDELTENSRKLALQLKRDIRKAEEIAPTWMEVVFRKKSRALEQILSARTRECLDFELSASGLVKPSGTPQEVRTDGMLRLSLHDRNALEDQRDILRTLLTTFAAVVSHLRERCESRLTNGINISIIVLTISSLAVAVVTLAVAKITYDDAKSSGEQQKKAMETEISSLNDASDALRKLALAEQDQEKLLRTVSSSAKKQTEYLGTEEAASREQNRIRQLQAGAGEISGLTQDLLNYYALLDDFIGGYNQLAEPLTVRRIDFTDQGSMTYYQGLLAREKFVVGKIGAWSREIQETGRSPDFDALMKANPFTPLYLAGKVTGGRGIVTLPSSENALERLRSTMGAESTRKGGPDLGEIALVMEHLIRNDFNTYTGIYRSYLQIADRACDQLSPIDAKDKATLELAAKAFELQPPTPDNQHANYMDNVRTAEGRKNSEFQVATSRIMEAWVRLVYVYGKSPLKWPD